MTLHRCRAEIECQWCQRESEVSEMDAELSDYCAALRICTDALLELGETDVLNQLIPYLGTPLNPKHAAARRALGEESE